MSERKRLLLVCGLPGTGKTTVANDLADHFDGVLLRTDVVRKELHPDPTYSSAETRHVYDEVFARVHEGLEDHDVVLDGTFRRPALRQRAARVAEEGDVEFELIHVDCPESVVRERIAGRNDDASDADFSVYKLIQSEFEPPAGAHHRIDNSGPLAETRAQVERVIAELEGRQVPQR